jgi:hypothetical protein
MIDTILADLIASSLRNDVSEVEAFVGLDADGRAPLGSFGARIQGAYLMRLIDRPQRDVLRCLKDVRNLFSHHVCVSFADQRVVLKVKRIYEIYCDTPPPQRRNRVYTETGEFQKNIEELTFSPDACSGMYVGAAVCEMKRIHESCRRRKAART